MHTHTIKRKNPRHQGDLGVAAAIAHFLGRGWRVAAPLGESQPWDLIVEDPDDARPQRVQVKTSTRRTKYGSFQVQISTRGGNQSWNGVSKRFDPSAVELLFMLTDGGGSYLIPSAEVGGRDQICVGRKYAQYHVDVPQLRLPL